MLYKPYMENWSLYREILTIHLFKNTFGGGPKRWNLSTTQQLKA